MINTSISNFSGPEPASPPIRCAVIRRDRSSHVANFISFVRRRMTASRNAGVLRELSDEALKDIGVTRYQLADSRMMADILDGRYH